jgi:hypothetical protein
MLQNPLLIHRIEDSTLCIDNSLALNLDGLAI